MSINNRLRKGVVFMKFLALLLLSLFLMACGGSGDSPTSSNETSNSSDSTDTDSNDDTNSSEDTTNSDANTDNNDDADPYSSSVTVTSQIAAKFLTQATFGPSEAEIDNLVSENDLEAWIDQQMALPTSLTQPYVEANSNGSLRSTRHDIWWKNLMEEDDQLRQRMAFALSQIFVITDNDYVLSNAQYGLTNYYDMLAEHAFGNYRELSERVTLHPTMVGVGIV